MKARVKIRRSVKAVSPVISVLLMIAIAVAASLIAYAWIMGYIGGTTTKAGKAILIQSMARNPGDDLENPADDKLVVYVQNVGQGTLTVDTVYVNDALTSFATINPTLEYGETAPLIVDHNAGQDERVTVKVVTTEGTFTQTTSGIGTGNALLPSSSLDHFEFDPIGNPQTTGVPFNITITAVDQYGNPFLSYGGTNTLTVSAGTINLQNTDPFTLGAWTGEVTLSSPTSGVTISTSGDTKTGISNTFDVNLPSPVLDGFVFDDITSQTVNQPFSITITAVDQYGAKFSYSGSGTLNDLTGTISPTGVTFTNGVATTSVTISTIRTEDMITVDSSGKSGESNTFDVGAVPAALNGFVFDDIATQTVNQPFTITITAIDQYGAKFSYSGSGTLSDLTGTISPTGVTFTNGVATTSVTITTTRTDDKITVNGNGKSGESNTFNVVTAGIPTTTYFIPPSSRLRLNQRWNMMGILYRTDRGWLSGGLNGKTITIVFTAPNSTQITKTVTTNWYLLSGVFTYSFKPDAVGTWHVTARFNGDTTYGPSQASTATFTVTT